MNSLINAGADLNIQDNDGHTALYYSKTWKIYFDLFNFSFFQGLMRGAEEESQSYNPYFNYYNPIDFQGNSRLKILHILFHEF